MATTVNWIQILKLTHDEDENKSEINPTEIYSSVFDLITPGLVGENVTYLGSTRHVTKTIKLTDENGIMNGFELKKCTQSKNLNTKCNKKTEIIMIRVKINDDDDNYYYTINDINLNFKNGNCIIDSKIITQIHYKNNNQNFSKIWCPFKTCITDDDDDANNVTIRVPKGNKSGVAGLSGSGSGSGSGVAGLGGGGGGGGVANIKQEILQIIKKHPAIFYLFCCNINDFEKIKALISDQDQDKKYVKILIQIAKMMIIDTTLLIKDSNTLNTFFGNKTYENSTMAIQEKIHGLIKIIEQSGTTYNLPESFVTILDYDILNKNYPIDITQINAKLLKFCKDIEETGNMSDEELGLSSEIRNEYESRSQHPWGFVRLNLIANGNDREPNQRFDIRTCDSGKIMLIDSVKTPEPMYIKEQNNSPWTINANYKDNDEIKLNAQKNGFKTENAGPKLKHVFGPFKKIYGHETKTGKRKEPLTNADIANDPEMIKIIDILKNKGETVLVVGYGASGAGKTSSLVYFNKGKTEKERIGILIQLCNLMKGHSTTISVSRKELCPTNIDYKSCDKEGEQIEEIEFTWQETHKTWMNDVTPNDFSPGYYCEPVNTVALGTSNVKNTKIKLKNKERIETLNSLDGAKQVDIIECDDNSGENCIDLAGYSIGYCSQLYVDSDRHVAATTNNPNSSRTHVLLFFKFHLADDKKSVLVIGDFAGSESPFPTTSTSVITAFANLKNDNDPNQKLKYYKKDDQNVFANRDDIPDFSSIAKVMEEYGIDETAMNNIICTWFVCLVQTEIATGSQIRMMNTITTNFSRMSKYFQQMWLSGQYGSTTIYSPNSSGSGVNVTADMVDQCMRYFNVLIAKKTPDPDATVTDKRVDNYITIAENYLRSSRKSITFADLNKTHIITENKFLVNQTEIRITRNNSASMSFSFDNGLMFWGDGRGRYDKYTIKTPGWQHTKSMLMPKDEKYYVANTNDDYVIGFATVIPWLINLKQDNTFVFVFKKFSNSCIKNSGNGASIEDLNRVDCYPIGVFKFTKSLSINADKTTTTSLSFRFYLYLKDQITDTTAYPQSNQPDIKFYEYKTILVKDNFRLNDSGGPMQDNNNAGITISYTQLSQFDSFHPDAAIPDFSQIYRSDATLKTTIEIAKNGLRIFVPCTITFPSLQAQSSAQSSRFQEEEKIIALSKTQNFTNNFNKIITAYKIYVTIKSFIVDICKMRTIEGNYINKALIALRRAIKIIFAVKNNGSPMLPLSVLGSLAMFDKPLNEILFNQDIDDDKLIEEIAKSDIIKHIFDYIISQEIIDFTVDSSSSASASASAIPSTEALAENYRTICKKLNVILMCVMNISKLTESSGGKPKLQYLEINSLRKIYDDIIDKGAEGEWKDKVTEIHKKIAEFYAELEQYSEVQGKVKQCPQGITDLKTMIGNPNLSNANDIANADAINDKNCDTEFEKYQKDTTEKDTYSDSSDNTKFSYLLILRKTQKYEIFVETLKHIIDEFDVLNSPTIIGTMKAMSEILNEIPRDIEQTDYNFLDESGYKDSIEQITPPIVTN
jgi:hypothetical protein